MKKLLEQIFKFAIVGGLSFIIDFVVYALLCNILGVHYIFAGICGFTVSIIFNYKMSMRYVFASKDDMSKSKEFVTFVVLSIIGAGLNSLILFVCVDVMYQNWIWLQSVLSIKLMNLAAKIIATAIVMVYNFVTRKIFLEKKED